MVLKAQGAFPTFCLATMEPSTSCRPCNPLCTHGSGEHPEGLRSNGEEKGPGSCPFSILVRGVRLVEGGGKLNRAEVCTSCCVPPARQGDFGRHSVWLGVELYYSRASNVGLCLKGATQLTGIYSLECSKWLGHKIVHSAGRGRELPSVFKKGPEL